MATTRGVLCAHCRAAGPAAGKDGAGSGRSGACEHRPQGAFDVVMAEGQLERQEYYRRVNLWSNGRSGKPTVQSFLILRPQEQIL